MAKTTLTENSTLTQAFGELRCSPSLVGGLQLESLSFSAVNIFFSVTAFLGNILIIVALRKETSLHPPSKLLFLCLATTDLLVGLTAQPLLVAYWMSIVYEHWSLCRYARDAAYIASYFLCGVSLSTMTAISVDRLLALLLGLRYREKVTLKRTYIIVATIWVLPSIAALFNILDYSLTLWVSRLTILTFLVTLIASYTKIFLALSHRQAEIQEHVQQQPRQQTALNMMRYKKAVNRALWVQLSLVVCYAPYGIVEIVISYSKTYSSHLFILWEISVVLVYFNSALNPFLYCWKIPEVRQSVKQTIKQTLCCSRS